MNPFHVISLFNTIVFSMRFWHPELLHSHNSNIYKYNTCIITPIIILNVCTKIMEIMNSVQVYLEDKENRTYILYECWFTLIHIQTIYFMGNDRKKRKINSYYSQNAAFFSSISLFFSLDNLKFKTGLESAEPGWWMKQQEFSLKNMFLS